MAKIIMLGTGNGGTTELYNTCFLIQNNSKNFLVDAGGGVEIIKRIQSAGVDIKEIKNIFISHSHTDHILGIFWFFKKISRYVKSGEITERINIYCNNTVYTAIKEVSKYILPNKLMEYIYKIVDFHILKNNDIYNICNLDVRFFDIKARGTEQFGFEINNKRLMFLGDETLNPELYSMVEDSKFVMHEAFCLDSEESKFKAYEKNHSTVKTVCEVMNKLNVKNLILYHTEESHGSLRKEIYTNEAKLYFNNNVIIPDDLETILIDL